MPSPKPSGLIDRVDTRDQRIGSVRRADALVVGANFRTVHVFVFDAGRRLLLQRLAATRERHPGRWGSSVAAYLHAGESYEQAAKRRLAEELCLRGDLRWVDKVPMRDRRSKKFVGLYEVVSGEAVVCEPDHIAELRYWPLDELETAVARAPERFTPTFLHLYRYFQRRAHVDPADP